MPTNIPIISTIVPAGNGIFPTHDAQYGKGGLMSVPDVATMNAISPLRRTAGMACVVQSGGTNTIYILGPDLLTWTPFTTTNTASASVTTIPITGNTTLTTSQFATSVLIFTGTLAQASTITVPGVPAKLAVCNYTTGGFPLTITTGSGATVSIASGLQRDIFSNGASVAYSTTDFNNVTLGNAVTAVTQPTSDNSSAVATTAFVHSVVSASTAGVATFNNRTGAVTLQQADVSPFIPTTYDGGTF